MGSLMSTAASTPAAASEAREGEAPGAETKEVSGKRERGGGDVNSGLSGSPPKKLKQTPPVEFLV